MDHHWHIVMRLPFLYWQDQVMTMLVMERYQIDQVHSQIVEQSGHIDIWYHLYMDHQADITS
jgi:hypothetical protein